MKPDERLGYQGVGALAVVVWLATFLWLREAPLFVPYQGVHSILAADSLNNGRGFEVVPGLPYAKFGPLYPLLLALLARAGLGVTGAVYLLNSAIFAASFFGLYLLCRILSVRAAWGALAFFALWAPNYYLLRSARPDALMISMSLFALAGMVHYSTRGSPGALVAAAAACSLAATARYIAVTALLPMMLVAVWLAESRARKQRLRDLAVFGVIAGGPIGIWLARNHAVTGFLSGRGRWRADLRPQAMEFGPLEHLQGFLKTVYVDTFGTDALGIRQVVYDPGSLSFPGLVAGSALLSATVLLVLGWMQRHKLGAFLAHHVRGRTLTGRGLVLIGGFTALYVSSLLALWTFSNNDPIETRYVAPIYACLIALGALFISVVLSGWASRWPRIAWILVLVLIGAPNLMKSIKLLRHDPPGQNLVRVVTVGVRGANWMPAFDWSDLAPLRASQTAPGED